MIGSSRLFFAFLVHFGKLLCPVVFGVSDWGFSGDLFSQTVRIALLFLWRNEAFSEKGRW